MTTNVRTHGRTKLVFLVCVFLLFFVIAYTHTMIVVVVVVVVVIVVADEENETGDRSELCVDLMKNGCSVASNSRCVRARVCVCANDFCVPFW